jgi:hypothetical protein
VDAQENTSVGVEEKGVKQRAEETWEHVTAAMFLLRR